MKKYFIPIILALALSASGQVKHPYASDKPMPFPVKFQIDGTTEAWHITFVPAGDTFYFLANANNMEIVKYCIYKDGKWTTSQLADFAGKYRIETPFITPDGKKFFFTYAESRAEDIYSMDRTTTGWTTATSIGNSVNTPGFDGCPTMAENGNLYFLSDRSGRAQLYCTNLKNGVYSEPKLVNYAINRNDIGEPYVSKNDSFLLFPRWRYDGVNYYSDLYISFRQNDSCWGSPKNLGPRINSAISQLRPYISPDGNYLFFNRDWIYQVDWKPLYDSLTKANSTPYLVAPVSSFSFKTGEEFKLKLSNLFKDDDKNDTLNYSAVLSDGGNLPNWLKLDNDSGLLSGTPNNEEIINISVTVKDKANSSTTAGILLMPDGFRTDVALGKTVSVSSTESGSTLASYAVDGLTSTRWSSSFSDPQWICINLNGIYSVSAVNLIWEAAYATGYRIEVSKDNVNWTSVYSTSNGNGGEEYISFNAVECQYVRMYGTQRVTPWGYSIFEFQVSGKYLREAPVNSITSVSDFDLELSPNPIMNKGIIKYNLKEKSQVELILIDFSGKAIETLVNEVQNKGHYEVGISGNSLKAGVYSCLLKTQQKSEIKKFVVVK